LFFSQFFKPEPLFIFNQIFTKIIMKKIGILFGQETTFPNALIDRINSKNVPGITAEAVLMYHVEQGKATEYAVILDRISQDVPFYRAYLKNAALQGTQIINNPFWWSADEKFFNNCLAIRLGVPVPKTVLLPSNQLPPDTTEQSFRNLGYPLNWEAITEHIGFPAYMKPHSGGGWKHVYKVNHLNELFDRHREAGSLVMLLQEEIVFEEYYRCYCIGRKYVLVMPYEPRNPHELRYTTQFKPSEHMVHLLTDYVLRLNNGLGYDFNTVEFAVRDGVPYAIDFCNPAPDADIHSVGASNFEWVVEHAARYAIECALEHKSDRNNITWGNFVIQSIDQFLKNNQGAPEKNSGSTSVATAPKIASNIAEPKKRGRKPKVKTEIEVNAIKAESKKRGRKPKEKINKIEKTEIEATAIKAEPKKRGRKPKEKINNIEKTEIEVTAIKAEPKKRGRKPKAKIEGELTAIKAEPKKRGRKPKEKTEIEVTAIKAEPKKRGRKPKVAAVVSQFESEKTAKKSASKKNMGRTAEKKQKEEPELSVERKPKRVKKLNLTSPKSTEKKATKKPAKKTGGAKKTKIERPPIAEFGLDAVNLTEKMQNPNL
jgi:hypothetical protein